MSSLKLLTPTTIGGLPVKNRLAMAPMTRGRSGRAQVPTETVAEYYAQRAGDAGLIITEGALISDSAVGWAGAPCIYRPEDVEGWRKVTEAVHAKGGVIFVQLWHMGRTASSYFRNLQPIAPSAIAAEGQITTYEGTKVPYEVPKEMTADDIKRTVGEYAHAASLAKEAGFDGIELHAANGYLLDEFLQSISNHRTDAYGGSFENRFRIVAEALEACKAHFPSNRIGIKLGPNGVFGSMGSEDNLDAFTYYLQELDKHGLAYVHIADGLAFGYHGKCPALTLNEARKHYHGALIGNCGYTKDAAEAAIQAGDADMIAFGRPFIANPDLAERFAKDAPLAEADYTTYYGYPDFPEGDATVGYTDFKRHDEA
jgi:2,4-dienoyl-CoA reductase-like NADH-dependent reductase (Old Yellow Enzyme family)